MNSLKLLLRILLRSMVAILIFVIIYVVAAFGLPYIAVNSDYNPGNDVVEVYLLTNGVHTDIVVPFRHQAKDWSRYLDPGETKGRNPDARYVAFGWGDKGFYLDTPTWADLKVSTAISALCYMSSSAMHVTFYRSLSEDRNCRKIAVSRKSYERLCYYIESSFKKDEKDEFIKIDHSYGTNDLFFDAEGKYSFFTTCNTWTNSGLKEAGVKACLWTALDKGIFYQYETEEK